MEKVGLQMYTLRKHMNDVKELASTLERVREIGYDCVQMSTPHYMQPKAFREMLDALKLFTCSGSLSYVQAMNDPTPAIREAEILGVRDLFFGDTIWPNLRGSLDGFGAFAKMLNQAGAIAAKYGMRIHYHFHALEFASFGRGKNGMDVLIEQTNPDNVYFMPDTHWMQAGGVEPSIYLERFSGRMSQVHFKDYGILPQVDLIEDTKKLFLEVGEGNLDFLQILHMCRQMNVEYVVVEQDETLRDPFESVEISLKNIRGFQDTLNANA